LYNRHYVCTLLHNLGFSFQKARFVSDHLDAAKRLAWLEEKWPAIFRAATRRQGLILFEDEASFAQWGSLSYTWARRGQQPEVPTSGKRKGYKVFGAIEYFSGRLFYQGIEGRFNSEHYQAFLQMIMEQTTEHLFLIHDGARYHTSASTQAFLVAHRDRITEHPLPSYSPDDNPIEYLWRNTKKRATHNTLVSGKSGDFPLWKAVGGECDEALPTPMPLYTLGQMPCHRRLFPQWAFWYGDLGKIHAQEHS